MKKYIIIGFAIVLAIVLIVGIFSTGLPMGHVTLSNSSTSVSLSGSEAMAFRTFFTFRFYRYGIGGCPFNESTSIRFGNREFVLATDGCYCVKDVKSGHCIELNEQQWSRLQNMIAEGFYAN